MNSYGNQIVYVSTVMNWVIRFSGNDSVVCDISGSGGYAWRYNILCAWVYRCRSVVLRPTSLCSSRKGVWRPLTIFNMERTVCVATCRLNSFLKTNILKFVNLLLKIELDIFSTGFFSWLNNLKWLLLLTLVGEFYSLPVSEGESRTKWPLFSSHSFVAVSDTRVQ